MVQNRLVLIIHFLRAQNEKILVYGAGAAWSRLFLPGAGADPSRSEPESAPGPWRPGAGAAQKSGGSATLALSSFLEKNPSGSHGPPGLRC